MSLLFSLVRAAHAGAELAAINAMRQYVKVLTVARRIVQADLAIHLLTALAISGFLLIHIAVFLMLPWAEPWVRALVLGIMGFVYMTVGLAVLMLMGSSRLWVKGTGVREMIGDIELPREAEAVRPSAHPPPMSG